jgi:hypothetical protein
MASLKDRRNSGRYTPVATCTKKELLENNIEIPIEYDDWQDHRDGMRDWYRDAKMIKDITVKYHRRINDYDIKRIAFNKKQKQLLKIRKAKRDRLSK